MKEGIKLILRYFLAVIVWGLLFAGMLYGFFSLHGDSYCSSELAGFIIVFLATILASYCLPIEQRFYLGIILSIWIVFFGFFLKDTSASNELLRLSLAALLSSLFHYLKDNKLFIKYFLGAVFVLVFIPIIVGESPEIIYFKSLNNFIEKFFPADYLYTQFFWALVSICKIVVYCVSTIAFGYFLPIPHRLYFALSVSILGSLPRLITLTISASGPDFWPHFGFHLQWVSFSLGTIAAVLFLYWRQKKLENRVDHSFSKTP